MREPVVVRVPGDKSISHRALLLASLGDGESVLRNLLAGQDLQSTAAALRTLGCAIPPLPLDGGEVRIPGAGLAGWMAPGAEIDCGNSGTTARLLLGALAARPFRSVLTGDASLRARPMRRVTDPLARVGAHFEELGAPDRLPIAVRGGQLAPIDHDTPYASAQVKSALLLAALLAGTNARVSEPFLSRDHTERMFRAMGVDVRAAIDPAGRAGVWLRPVPRLTPLDLTVPGDPSSAAFFLGLGLLGTRPVRVDGVSANPTRTGFLAVLRRMGASVETVHEEERGGEPTASMIAAPSRLRGTTVRGDEIPSLIDEVPILAVLASRAEGETRIEGAAELRVKESDRIAALATNLAALGTDVEETPDGLRIRGGDAPPVGGVRAFHDHRMAMAFGVLGALPHADVAVDTPAIADVSFPGFWTTLRAVSAAR